MLKTRFLLSLFIVVVAISSCKKDEYNAEKQAKVDDQIIVDYIAKNSIVALKHNSGLYYQVINPGSGNTTITSSTSVTVNYQGKLLSGAEFDKSSAPVTFSLGSLIQGWQIGIPLIQKGGRIRLIIPSTLAYQNKAQNGIPANSVLDFTIDLINVQ